MNQMKTLVLLATLTALLVWIGQALGGHQGMVIGLGMAIVMNVGSYWYSDKIVLRMYGAQPIDETQAPELYSIVRTLAQAAQIPMPKVYVIPEQAPNAFATGRNPEHAAVACTEGLLRLLNRDEITAVLAHELGHVRNRDTLIMVVAATLGGAISMIANIAQWGLIFGGGRSNNDEGGHPAAALIGIIVAPLAAMLIQMAISRSREFLADEQGARLSGQPLALCSALRKIEGYAKQAPMQHGSPATAHLFIINPFTAGAFAKLFSTHPSTDERIARLEQMARSGM
ncbi:zinc metalloprotease HtpX [bacterium]|nr:zinc metalloprotease HtpX [bacterium]